MDDLADTLPEDLFPRAGLDAGLTCRYDVLHRLGAGGSGEVFKAYDHTARRYVALKRLKAHRPEPIARFENEFHLLRLLRHPNIVRAERMFFDGESLSYAMDLVEGVPIDAYFRGRPIDPRAVATTVRPLVHALGVLHREGFAHCDVKPANILVSPRGHAVLLDFGSATEIEADPPDTGWGRRWVGSPTYMAPEQFYGDAPSPAIDMYALGELLYECLTGARAFPQATLPALMAAKQRAAVEWERLSGPALGLVRGLLSPDPRLRPTPGDVLLLLVPNVVGAEPRGFDASVAPVPAG